MKLKDVLPILQDTYESIEIDVACGYYQDKWVNLLTTTSFAHEDSSSMNKVISENKKCMQLGNGQRFRIYKKYLPLEEFGTIATSLLNGTFPIDKVVIHYDPVDLENYDLSFRQQYSVNDKWGEFFNYRFRKQNTPYYTAQFIEWLKGDVLGLGFEDIDEAIQFLIDKDHRPNSSSDFIVRAPFFSSLEAMKIEESRIRVVVRYHKKLRNLILQYRKYHADAKYGQYSPESQVSVESYNQTDGTTTQNGDFNLWQIDVEELNLSQSYKNDACEISLFFEPLGQRISNERKSLTELLAEKSYLANNPLAKSFTKFCSLDKYREMLRNPQVVRKDGFSLSDTDNFERAVQWLFSLCGFSTIWLGKDLEIIRDEQGRNLGSADLLCYHSNDNEKTLVLVSCKTSVPDERHIDLIKNLAGQISEEMAQLGVKVVPMIASSKPINALRDKCSSAGVSVIDIDDIKKVISEIDKHPPDPYLLLEEKKFPPFVNTFGLNP